MAYIFIDEKSLQLNVILIIQEGLLINTHVGASHIVCFRGKKEKYQYIRDDKAAITITHLYNFDPLKPHFYIVKLGFTGVYNIVLISA